MLTHTQTPNTTFASLARRAQTTAAGMMLTISEQDDATPAASVAGIQTVIGAGNTSAAGGFFFSSPRRQSIALGSSTEAMVPMFNPNCSAAFPRRHTPRTHGSNTSARISVDERSASSKRTKSKKSGRNLPTTSA